MMEPVVMRSAGLDVHRMSVVATILIEEEDGSLREETRTLVLSVGIAVIFVDGLSRRRSSWW